MSDLRTIGVMQRRTYRIRTYGPSDLWAFGLVRWCREDCYGVSVSTCQHIFIKRNSVYIMRKACEDMALLPGVSIVKNKINGATIQKHRRPRSSYGLFRENLLDIFCTMSRRLQTISIWLTKLKHNRKDPRRNEWNSASFKEALTKKIRWCYVATNWLVRNCIRLLDAEGKGLGRQELQLPQLCNQLDCALSNRTCVSFNRYIPSWVHLHG